MKARFERAWVGLCVLVGALAGMPAHADQLIRIPTADIVPGPKTEYLQRVDGKHEGYATLLVPAGLAYELAFRYYNNEDRSHNIEGGGMFQLLPDGVITPGVAVGMWDVSNSSPQGRRAFVVVTKSIRQGQFFVPKPLERLQLTLGSGTGRFSGVLAALRVDLPAHFTLISEYDARRFNAGIWFRPVRPLTLKAELQNGNPYLGGDFTLRF